MASRDPLEARSGRYTARKIMQTPAWADGVRMAQMYAQARRWNRVVDHIVPLSHPRVCGLHCEANLQIVSHAENAAKSNHWWPDMPGEQTQLPFHPTTPHQASFSF